MSLESDLEQIIEYEEQQRRDAKRRRSEPRPSIAPGCSNGSDASTSSAGPAAGKAQCKPRASIEDQLAQLASVHATASAAVGEARALCKRREEFLQMVQVNGQELAEKHDRLEAEVSQADQQVHSNQEQLIWLEDIAAKCEHAKSANCFADDVLEAFNMMLSNMHRASELQGARTRDLEAAHRSRRAEWQASCNARRDNEMRLGEARAAVAQAEDDAKTAQMEVDRLSSQIKQTRAMAQLQKQIDEQGAVVKEARRAAETAASHRDTLHTQLSEYSLWSEDLLSFFDGKAVQDGGAILRGLQALVPSRDPLPTLVRSLLSQDGIDMASHTGISMQKLVSDQLHIASSRLRSQVQAHETSCEECNSKQAEAQQRLRKLEEQAKSLCAMPGIRSVATPMRSAEGRRSLPSNATTSGPARRGSSGGSHRGVSNSGSVVRAA